MLNATACVSARSGLVFADGFGADAFVPVVLFESPSDLGGAGVFFSAPVDVLATPLGCGGAVGALVFAAALGLGVALGFVGALVFAEVFARGVLVWVEATGSLGVDFEFIINPFQISLAICASKTQRSLRVTASVKPI